MKKWKIPVSWEMYGFIEEEGETLEEAIEKAEKYENFDEGYPLPTDGEYVDGSFELQTDVEYVTLFNEE